MTVAIEVAGVSLAYPSHPVLAGLSFRVPAGGFLGVIGPNGSGKSTLLKALVGVLRPRSGAILLDGRDLAGLTSLEVARQVAVVPQQSRVDFAFTVAEVVLMGRYPFESRFGGEQPRDLEAAHRAMELTHTLELGRRPVNSLSGGELQRVILARALAQEPKALLLDEPTAHLDLGYQAELLGLVRRLNQQEGLTVIAVLHDLNQAAEYCDTLLLLHQGAVWSLGRPDEVITAAIIREVYRTEVVVARHPLSGRPQLTVLGQEQPAGTPPPPAAGIMHLIGGGGCAAPLLPRLVARGVRPSLGVLNRLDSDWRQARALGLEVVEEAPFSPIGEESWQRNLKSMLAARAVVVLDLPWGRGNLSNLEAAATALKQGRPVYLVDPGGIAQRDYTGGEATAMVQRMLAAGARVLAGPEDVLSLGGIIREEVGADEPGKGYSSGLYR